MGKEKEEGGVRVKTISMGYEEYLSECHKRYTDGRMAGRDAIILAISGFIARLSQADSFEDGFFNFGECAYEDDSIKNIIVLLNSIMGFKNGE